MNINPREIAAQLVRARQFGNFTKRPSLLKPSLTLEEAYDMYLTAHGMLEENNYEPVGRKLGFTNRQTWEEFDLSAPIWAYIYRQTIQFGNEASVDVSKCASPRIEPEIVLKLNDKILEYGDNKTDMTDVIQWVAIGFEIVDCHYQDWNFNAPDIVIDFGAHAQLVIGKPVIVDNTISNLEEKTETLSVRLSKDGELMAIGQGKNVLGGPLKTLKFLVDEIKRVPDRFSLKPGEIITTGTLTDIPFIQSGERWEVEVEGLSLDPLSIEIK